MKSLTHITNLLTLPLYETLTDMLESKKINWGIHNQICINTVPGHEDDFFYGAASLEYDWNNSIILPSGEIKVPKRDITLSESDFTVLCNSFKDTVFEKMYNNLTSHFNVGRVRVIMLKPKTCLTWHTDSTTRLHFPLKTQEGCMMIIDSEVFHIPENEWWLTNTVMPHTAINSSKDIRIHLVASILD
jgi:hypothetical protein